MFVCLYVRSTLKDYHVTKLDTRLSKLMYEETQGEFVRMCSAVMAFWSDKSLPKAAETTIANSVSPLARSIRSPLRRSLLMTITLSAEMEAFTVAGWQREKREGGCISYVWVYGFMFSPICMMLPRFSLYSEFQACI